MSAASNYTEQNVLNALLRGATFPLPTNTYVALHTADPTDAGGSEVSTTNWPAYVRRQAEAGGAIGSGWTAPGDDGVSTNTNQLTYPGMDGALAVTVTHWAVYDALSGGNMLCHAALQTPRTLQTGDVFVFDIGSLTVTMA
jgi:hypothetical protein